MADRINVCRDGKAIYDIVLTQSFDGLKEAVSCLPVKEHKICIVTDSNVAPLYLEEVRAVLAGCCKSVSVFTFPAGEENKHLDTVRNLYEHLILERFDRKDMLAALGGGVVGDLCGFAAATYLRGVDFIQIPTTLLSQVDSSIGGKTGVDFDAYKNMVGAFHMPRLVYANLRTLLTLPEEQFSSGMGEVVKHGLIKNREYYQWLKDNREGIAARNLDLCQAMVYESCMIKKRVVEEDPTEQGERALLNFGHTLGHAVEKLENFTMHHGTAWGWAALGLPVSPSSEACLQRRRWRTSEIPSFPLEFLTLRRVLCGIRSLKPPRAIKRLTPASSVLSCLRPLDRRMWIRLLRLMR